VGGPEAQYVQAKVPGATGQARGRRRSPSSGSVTVSAAKLILGEFLLTLGQLLHL